MAPLGVLIDFRSLAELQLTLETTDTCINQSVRSLPGFHYSKAS